MLECLKRLLRTRVYRRLAAVLLLLLAPLPLLAQDAARAPQFVLATGSPGVDVGGLQLNEESDRPDLGMETAELGDYLLYNRNVQVVIGGIHPASPATGDERAGRILDVRSPGGRDALGSLRTCVGDVRAEPVQFSALFLTHNGNRGDLAELVAVGTVPTQPGSQVITRFQLKEGEKALRILTQLNLASTPSTPLRVGDCLDWGSTEPVAAGRDALQVGSVGTASWLAGLAPDLGYGLVSPDRLLDYTVAFPLTAVFPKQLPDESGLTQTYSRFLVLTGGELEPVVARSLTDDTARKYEVVGRVVEVPTRAPVGGVTVVVRSVRTGGIFSSIKTDASGVFDFNLDDDGYVLQAFHPGRGTRQAVKLNAAKAGARAVVLEVTAPGCIRAQVRSESGPLWTRLQLEGINGTPNPRFGPPRGFPGAGNVWLLDPAGAEISVPPGQYRVTASRGIEYSILQRELAVGAGQVAAFVGTIEREVDTGGYLAADFNLFSRYTPGGSHSPDQLVSAALAEGLEVISAADTDRVVDYLRRLQERELETQLKVVTGQTAAAPLVGRLLVFPVEPNPDAPGNGRLSTEAAELASQVKELRNGPDPRVLLATRPTDPGGIFRVQGVDPFSLGSASQSMTWAFDGLEVLTPEADSSSGQLLRAWFNLLNRGVFVTALGGSGGGAEVEAPPGQPRSYLGLYADRPGTVPDSEIVSLLAEKRNVLVTNGPFIRVEANRRAVPGNLLTLSHGSEQLPVRISVEVQGPRWLEVSEIQLIHNGVIEQRIPTSDPYGLVKYSGQLELKVDSDGWFVVLARGGETPVRAPGGAFRLPAFGFTNPIWLDVNGNRSFEAPLSALRPQGLAPQTPPPGVE